VAKWFRYVPPGQDALLPADMRSWLPPGHLAWQVTGAVGELDLSGFTAAYRADGQGQAPYDPAMMLALVLYCYFKGIRSSRKIAAACIDDVGCRVICGGAAPSHQAVAQFVRRHRAEVVPLFVQVLGLLAAAGAVGGHCAAVDGSPVSRGTRPGSRTWTRSSWRPASPRCRPRSTPRRRPGCARRRTSSPPGGRRHLPGARTPGSPPPASGHAERAIGRRGLGAARRRTSIHEPWQLADQEV
jgi:transposase